MGKDVTPQQMEKRKKARQLARTAGKDWRNLSKDDRRVFVKQARKGEMAEGGDKQRGAAKAAAEQEGRKWRELSKEERKAYMAKARGTSGAGRSGTRSPK